MGQSEAERKRPMACRGLAEAGESGAWVGGRGRGLTTTNRGRQTGNPPPRHRPLSSCGPAVPPARREEVGSTRRACVHPPPSAPARATRIRSWDLRSRKVTANFLAGFARPFSVPDPPPCGAGNSEGRSAGRDGECGGIQRTLETKACRSSVLERRWLRALSPPGRPVTFSVVPMGN